MISTGQDKLCGASVSELLEPGTLSPRQLASVIKRAWQAGDDPDTARALAEHPALRSAKALQIDLAYEEYLLRKEAGERLDVPTFCARFPSLKASLRRVLNAHEVLEENPDLLDAAGPVWPELGDRLLGFRLRDELGRGAFARVYLAEEPALGNRPVAVKVAWHGASEAETLGRLRHPNIVPVYSVREDTSSGLTAVCMPFLGRATLCDLLDQLNADGPLPRRTSAVLEAINSATDATDPLGGPPSVPHVILRRGTYAEGVALLGAQLAEALNYAHRLGVYHRDLKPSNVLLTAEGTPLLLDFNLSHDARLTERRLGGTLPYMAPEQLEATDPKRAELENQVGARSDIYALAVMLCELLTGKHPFGPLPPASTQRELRALLLERQSQGPSRAALRKSGIEPAFARLLEQCLAFRPEQRPTSAAEVARALRRSLAPSQQLKRTMARRPWVTLAACCGLFVAVALGTVALVRGSFGLDGRRAESLVELEGLGAEPTTAVGFFQRARTRQHQAEAGDTQQFEEALQDYQQADKQEASSRNKAGMAYCLSRRARPAPAAAMDLYERTLEGGLQNAEIYNNLGVAYFEVNRLAEAQRALNEAIQRDPKLQAPYFNRALIAFKLGVRPKAPRHLLEAAIADMRVALELGPPSAELCEQAALLFTRAAHDGPERREAALACLESAVAEGADPEHPQFQLNFKDLAQEPRFQALRKKSPDARPTKAARLLDPLRVEPASTATAAK